MIIVLDANIVFSALLNPGGPIGSIIFSNTNQVFITPEYLINEINKHTDKLIKLTGKSENEISQALAIVLKRFTVYADEIIPDNILNVAKNFVQDVDTNDYMYVAFALFFQAKLWSGDKVLTRGLQAKGVDIVISTPEVFNTVTR